jgi:hypothetical protein
LISNKYSPLEVACQTAKRERVALNTLTQTYDCSKLIKGSYCTNFTAIKFISKFITDRGYLLEYNLKPLSQSAQRKKNTSNISKLDKKYK